MMVGAGLGVGVDLDRAGPDLLRADPGEIDRRGAVHARRLGGVAIELIARDDLDPVDLPIGVLVLVTAAHLARSAPLGWRGF